MPAKLALVLLGAALLRLWGIGWGLPREGHLSSYHPDEWNTLRSLANMRPAAFDLNPRYFHNPSLYYYACGLSFAAARAVGLVSTPLSPADLRGAPRELRKLYLIGRGLSVAASLGAIACAAGLAAHLGGARAAAWAALMLAVAPGPVVLAHYMDLDPSLSLFTTGALWAGLKASEAAAARWAVLAGALAGLACSTKYNGILVVPAVLALCSLGPVAARLGRLRRLLAASLAMFAAFFAGTPYALLDQRAFVAGVKYVIFERAGDHWSGLGHSLAFPLTTWRWSLGSGLLALLLASTAFAASRRDRRLWIVIGFVAACYASVAVTGADYARYSLPALPPLAALGGLMLAALPELARPGLRLAVRASALAAVAWSLALSSAWVALMAGPDVRDSASAWLDSKLGAAARVVVPREPYFHSPALIHAQYWYNRPASPLEVPDRLRVVSADWSLQQLEREPASVVVLSEYEVLYPTHPESPNARLLERLLDARAFVEVARFEARPTLGGRPLEAPFPEAGWRYSPAAARRLADQGPPADFKYLNPTLLVLAPRQGEAIDPAALRQP